jgi:predicted anti-sigma-YlaC factor YlaD
MSCEEIREHIDDYILGEVDPALEIRINEHVLSCAQCRRELEEREAGIGYFAAVPKAAVPDGAFRTIRSRLFPPRRGKRPFFASFGGRLVFVSAAFLVGMVLMRMVDVASFRVKARPAIETKARPYYRIPFADTIKFYSAPAKNLARI